MKPAELRRLEEHLSKAGCYNGAIDGNLTPGVRRAIEACPNPEPILRIETGFHIASIRTIAVDAQCEYGVTGSRDKTVRIWKMSTGDLVRTQRLPIDRLGAGGEVNAVAMTQDGRLVAAAGKDAAIDQQTLAFDASLGNAVYLFDRANGTSTRRIGGFENAIKALRFSPDGRRLAVALGAGNGVRVIDVETARIVMADRNFGGRDVYAIGYGPDQSLFVAAFDGSLRKYRKDMVLEKRVGIPGGGLPTSIAADPGGEMVAVAMDDKLSVLLFDARTLAFLRRAKTDDLSGENLNVVAWSRDGTKLFATGRHSGGDNARTLRMWADRGTTIVKDAKLYSNAMSMAACGDGVVVATTEPAFGLVHADGRVELATGQAAKMSGKVGDAFTVSPDGKKVRFGLSYAEGTPIVFDVAGAALADAGEVLRSPDVDTLPLKDWQNTDHPSLRGRKLKVDAFEVARSAAVLPSRSGFALGTEYGLRSYAASGGERWFAIEPAPAWGVNMARDGDLVVAAVGDGTIRWHRWSDGKELLAFFVNKDTRKWVAWTPSGYYMAAPGAEDMIGWHVNRGWEQPADFFPASRFHDTYARPDIVQKVLDTLDEDEAVRQANAARGGAPPAAPVIDRLPPVVSILAPNDGATVGDTVKIDFLVRSPSGLPVDAVEALVDGRPSGADRGLGRVGDDVDLMKSCLVETAGAGRLVEGRQGCRGSLVVHLPAGTSEVGLFARSGDRAGDVAKVRLMPATAAGDAVLKPKLYALVVGISAYSNKDYALGYAAKDANDFAAAIGRQRGGLYGDVSVRILADGQATGTAIKDGLDWLTKQVTSRDVGLVYLAGHGLLDERDRFYFLAADSDAARLRATAVPREDISDALDSLAGKALLFLDACHSGAIAGTGGRRGLVDINNVVNEFTRTERGVVAFTASTGRQMSQENVAWGNGAFTKAVIEGLGLPGQKAGADYRGDGKITTSELDAYVSERVKALTGGAQSPVMIRPPTVPDFPLAIAR